MRRCYFCFTEYEESFTVCPHCGQVHSSDPVVPIHLTPGTLLANRYIVGMAANSGGFGIVYRAWDTKLETIIAIKEFFVPRFMTRVEGVKNVIVNKKSQEEYEYRKKRVLAEARTMAQFGGHRNIPNVFEVFEENNTAYIVMEFMQGCALDEYLLQHNGQVSLDFVLLVANEVGHALQALHEHKIIHRDVAPDNIFICSGRDITIKLTDFGAARLLDETDDSIDIVLKPGYSPVEQYDKSLNIGPWTDVYALGATLYVMLTNTKPDESTNRKIEDTVVPPIELNPKISNNLNNTILKAMAVQRHMRFKNVEEFLNAINGEKKIVPLNQEKRRRRMRRIAGIVATCIFISAMATLLFNLLVTKKEEENLEAATITVWFSVTEKSSEEIAMKNMIDDFSSKYKSITIHYEAIPETEYYRRIREASKEGKMPTLFESTGLHDDVLMNTIALDNVIDSTQYDECIFMDDYLTCYPSKKQMPLAIEVPVAYVITSGYKYTSYESDYFTDISDFDSAANVSTDKRYADLLNDNFNLSGFADASAFLNPSRNLSSVMISSSMAINEVRDLQSYGKKYVYCDKPKLYCKYTYEWSISQCSQNEQKAAEVLLSWMLGTVYQGKLMLDYSANGLMVPEIPINEACFIEKTSQFDSLKPLKSIYGNFVFYEEEEDND